MLTFDLYSDGLRFSRPVLSVSGELNVQCVHIHTSPEIVTCQSQELLKNQRDGERDDDTVEDQERDISPRPPVCISTHMVFVGGRGLGRRARSLRRRLDSVLLMMFVI